MPIKLEDLPEVETGKEVVHVRVKYYEYVTKPIAIGLKRVARNIVTRELYIATKRCVYGEPPTACFYDSVNLKNRISTCPQDIRLKDIISLEELERLPFAPEESRGKEKDKKENGEQA